MPTSAYSKFNVFVQDLAQKTHNLATDQITVALCAAASPPLASNTVLANLTQISYTNCSARTVTTTSAVQTSGTLKFILADLTLTAGAGAVGPFRYVVFYNSTAAGGPLIGWHDYGADVTLNAGESLLIDLDNVSGLLTIA